MDYHELQKQMIDIVILIMILEVSGKVIIYQLVQLCNQKYMR